MATGTSDPLSTINGIEMEVLQGTVAALQEDPSRGRCHFRVSNTWLEGNHNCSTVEGYFGGHAEHEHKQTIKLYADEPPMLAGHDEGANPVEHLLNALAACVTTSMVAHAAVRGIRIDELESHVEGDIDLNGFLGLDPAVPKGFTDIRMSFRVRTDEKNLTLLKRLATYSPVFNTVTDGANVDIDVQQM